MLGGAREAERNEFWCPRVLVRAVWHQNEGGWAKFLGYVEEGPAEISRREIHLVGVMPAVKQGQAFAMTLARDNHPTYGEQYKVRVAAAVLPVSAEGVAAYLSANLEGVGEKTARRIVEAFGESTVRVLDSAECEARLRDEAHIRPKLAALIAEQWGEQHASRQLQLLLLDCGLSMRLAVRVEKHFGTIAAEVVRETPYRLLEVHGIGFQTADAVALRSGVPTDSPQRMWAGLTYAAQLEALEEGHCYTGRERLSERAAELLRQPYEVVYDVLTKGTPPPECLLVIDARGERIWLRRLRDAETSFAMRIASLRATPTMFQHEMTEEGWAEVWREYTRQTNIELSGEQKLAVRALFREKVSLLTGGPGTGKTTILRALLVAFDLAKIGPVTLCSPTGKAAKRLSEATAQEATTIHRALEWGSNGPLYNADCPMPAHVCVVDEASMVDITLAATLAEALASHAHLIFVGDTDQLPSVGPGRVLADLSEAGVPHMRLTHVFRQAARSLITQTAYAVNRGEEPEFPNDLATDDCFMISVASERDAIENIKTLVNERIPRVFEYAPSEIKVLAPVYKGGVGINELNRALQEVLNPPEPGKVERPWGEGATLREGDRLIWLTNNYQLGLINGDEVTVAQLVEIEGKWHAVLTREEFYAEPVTLKVADLEAKHAYALSVHKAQGSEYPCVIFLCHASHARVLSRRLAYTAITRARRLAVIVGSREALKRAGRNDRETLRRTELAARLRAYHDAFAGPPAERVVAAPAAAVPLPSAEPESVAA